jgi:REP element-mobilizing transposase RayT
MEYENALYHVTSRGNGRQVIFHTDDDRKRFLSQLQDNLESYGVRLHAWVLMANHFHLVVRTPRANLSRFMQRLNSSYSLYYRYKHGKPGHVLGGRYKSPVIENDEYLLAATRYVHLNPVKTRIQMQRTVKMQIAFLEGYAWSSYPAYIGKISFPDWLDKQVLSTYGRDLQQARRRYRAYVQAGLLEDNTPIQDLMKANAYAIGSAGFVADTASALAQRTTGGPRDADISLPRPHASFAAIDREIARRYGLTPEDLRGRRRAAGVARTVAMELAARTSGQTLRAIGQHYGNVSSQAVAMARKRLKQNRDVDWTEMQLALAGSSTIHK